jgi:hypothetical protein
VGLSGVNLRRDTTQSDLLACWVVLSATRNPIHANGGFSSLVGLFSCSVDVYLLRHHFILDCVDRTWWLRVCGDEPEERLCIF